MKFKKWFESIAMEDNYTDEEVSLDAIGKILGNITYTFEYVISGKNIPQSYYEPAEHSFPEIVKITDIEINEMSDEETGAEVGTPPLGWQKFAQDHFWKIEKRIVKELIVKVRERIREN